MTTQPASQVSFSEALRFWLQLGFISFGGPAGQIAITVQCCPVSVMTVTDLRLYFVMTPNRTGCPSGWNDTRSPRLNSNMDAWARICCRNLRRATIRLFRSTSSGSVSLLISIATRATPYACKFRGLRMTRLPCLRVFPLTPNSMLARETLHIAERCPVPWRRKA